MDDIRVIVAGGRDFTDYRLLCNTLNNLLSDKLKQVTIISGTAKGADSLGERFAKFNNVKLKQFPADWSIGKRAGYIRNEQMAKYAAQGKGVLIAFWDNKSKGTKNMINIAKNYGLEVHIINY